MDASYQNYNIKAYNRYKTKISLHICVVYPVHICFVYPVHIYFVYPVHICSDIHTLVYIHCCTQYIHRDSPLMVH